MEYFWINDTQLEVNGEILTPEEAYAKYPDNAEEIKSFVEKRNSWDEKLSDIIDHMKPNDPFYAESDNDENLPSIFEMVSAIKQAVDEIFERPEIQQSKNQKELAYRLFEYIIRNSEYDNSIMDVKANNTSNLFELEVTDVYHCLCLHKSVCSSDAAALSFLFRRAGIPSTYLIIAKKGDKMENVHEVVKMTFGEEQFICDPTLVRTALQSGDIPDINPSVFAFTPDYFFKMLYPSDEIKVEQMPLPFLK